MDGPMDSFDDRDDPVRLRVDDARRTPAEGLFFAVAAMAPMVAGAVAVWWLDDDGWITRLLLLWAAGILCFLAGVRRGLSFRTPGGARPSQIATSLWLFALAFAALASPWPMVSSLLLIVGFVSVGVFDPLAARKQEAPPFFARLRPVQMLAPVVSLTVLAVHISVVS